MLRLWMPLRGRFSFNHMDSEMFKCDSRFTIYKIALYLKSFVHLLECFLDSSRHWRLLCYLLGSSSRISRRSFLRSPSGWVQEDSWLAWPPVSRSCGSNRWRVNKLTSSLVAEILKTFPILLSIDSKKCLTGLDLTLSRASLQLGNLRMAQNLRIFRRYARKSEASSLTDTPLAPGDIVCSAPCPNIWCFTRWIYSAQTYSELSRAWYVCISYRSNGAHHCCWRSWASTVWRSSPCTF